MFTVTAVLLLLLHIAVSVTVVDAVRAAHWRRVAVTRRQAWHERARHDDEPASGAGWTPRAERGVTASWPDRSPLALRG